VVDERGRSPEVPTSGTPPFPSPRREGTHAKRRVVAGGIGVSTKIKLAKLVFVCIRVVWDNNLIIMQQQLERETETPLVVSLAPALPQVVWVQSDTGKETAFLGHLKKAIDIEKEITNKWSVGLEIATLIVFLTAFGFSLRYFGFHVSYIFYIMLFNPFKIIANLYKANKNNKEFSYQSESLMEYQDMRSVGILVRFADWIFSKAQQDQIFQGLKPLLEAIKKSDDAYFQEQHQDALRRLAKNKRIRKEFPELMQAIIVALYTLHTSDNKLALEKLAKVKPKSKEEQWIPKAAQSCLDAWDNDNSIWF
jgi:hypothetical protein